MTVTLKNTTEEKSLLIVFNLPEKKFWLLDDDHGDRVIPPEDAILALIPPQARKTLIAPNAQRELMRWTLNLLTEFSTEY